jgi:hypothetical protein
MKVGITFASAVAAILLTAFAANAAPQNPANGVYEQSGAVSVCRSSPKGFCRE